MPFKATNNGDNRGYVDHAWRTSPTVAIRRQFCAFLQGLFEASDDEYQWTEDQDLTRIVIRDENPIHVDSIGKRPAINFTRGSMPAQQLGFNNLAGINMQTGTRTKVIMGASVMSINCSSAVDTESEAIAFIVWSHIIGLAEVLVSGGFFAIEAPTLGAPSTGDGVVAGSMAAEWYTTTVTVPFRITHEMAMTPLNNRIANNIKLRLRSVVNPLGGGAPQVDTYDGPPPYAVVSTPPQLTQDTLSDVRVPRPANPAATGRLVVAANGSQRIRGPAIGGRPLPLEDPAVKQSSQSTTETYVGPPPVKTPLGA